MLNSKLETTKELVDKARATALDYNSGKLKQEEAKNIFDALSQIYSTKYLMFNSGLALEGADSIDYQNIYDDGYMPQGLTRVGYQTFISAYNHDGSEARLYVYGPNGKCEYKVVLDTKAHVGGISYDEKNHVLLVTGDKGAVNAYSLDGLNRVKANISKAGYAGDTPPTIDLKRSDNSTIILNSNINMNYQQLANGNATTKYNSATTYYDNETGKIYIARFANDGKIICGNVKYDAASGTYNMENATTASIDNAVQGISIYHRDDKTYLVESRSYGANQAMVTVRDITDGIDNSKIVGSQSLGKTTHYSEGIFVDDRGQGTVLFERGSSSNESNNLTKNIDINRIIDEANGQAPTLTIKTDSYDKGAAEDQKEGYKMYY